jgi:CxxC motif-containing protein (DUF1111 family)
MQLVEQCWKWLVSAHPVIALTVGLAGCGGGSIGGPSHGGQGGSSDDTGGQGANGDGDGDGDGDGEGLPVLGCETIAPAQLASTCGGCHALNGQPSAYPDLFAYGGSEAEFIARVRAGGDGMPAFSEALIGDDVLRAGYAFLHADVERSAPTLGSVEPLFSDPAPALPVTFTRADGVLVTRAAGRVRQRHELEGTYNPFGPHYFEDRTYGFIIEDFTAKGESRIRVTYLPLATPTDGTNFRAWKIHGNGNVFHANMGMTSDVSMPSLAGSGMSGDYASQVAPYARVQVQEVTSNPRDNRPIQRGDQFEFEFGIFIDPGALTHEGSRTAYYTDTFRYQVGVGGLTPLNQDTSGEAGPVAAAWLGGATTVPWIYAEPETYFSQMALNVQHEHVQQFVEGRRLFHTDFGSGVHSEGGNPDFPAQAGKLGPLFATRSCSSCHEHNGGGHTLEGELSEQSSMAFKLYDAGELGNQLQLQEGAARLSGSEEKRITLADGTEVVLSRPRFAVDAGGDVPRFSARISRRLLGIGLLEAIDELTLLGRADPEDCNGDGISGRPSLVRDPESDGLRIGRFGWKAEKVSVEHQVADALDADLGVSTRIIHDGNVELDDADLARLTAYMRLLGVPGQRDRGDPAVARGELLFRTVGCAGCHAPEVITGENHAFAELRSQRARPYTDLLLHDLGPELADDSGAAGDGQGDAKPSASEWRTPPLWGVGLSRDVQGQVSLLHDGRAHSVLEAMLWHGGEATAVREQLVQLSTEDREALVRFVESL